MGRRRRSAHTQANRISAIRTIDSNPTGRWGVAAVQARYQSLRAQLGGVDGFSPEPLRLTNPRGLTWVYNIMEKDLTMCASDLRSDRSWPTAA